MPSVTRKRPPGGEDVGERLAEAIEEKFSQRRFAEAAGVNETTVSLWISGSIPEAWMRLRRVCQVAETSADKLLGLDSKAPPLPPLPPPPDPNAPAEFVYLPRVSAQVAAGDAIFDEDDRQEWYAFRPAWLRRLERHGSRLKDLFVVRVARAFLGESMLPTIRPGALLVIDRGLASRATVENDRIYLVRPDDEGATVKRVYASADHLILWGDNPATPKKLIEVGDRQLPDILLGRVRWIGQEEG